MITINNISKKFNNALALDNITLNIKPGDFCALLGSNGAGKSTLLRIIANLEHPNIGICQIEGLDVSDDHPKIKEKIAYIDENINFHVDESVEKFLVKYKSFYSSWDDSLLKHLFNKKFINKDAKFSELSRGQKMQLVLAASLARKPKYIMIDEVTSVMDIYIRKFFMDYLKDYAIKNNAVVIVATNIITELDFIANKMLMLNFGKVFLYDDYHNIKNLFVKIRKSPETKNPLFHLKECVWIHRNSDHTSSFLIKRKDLENYSSDGVLEDKRVILISEIFSYINSIERNNNHEEAA